MKPLHRLLGLSLAVVLGLACAQISVSPTSRYKVTERFHARPGDVDITGVVVKSALPEDVVPDSDLEKLGSFIAAGLRMTTIGAMVNRTGESFDGDEDLENGDGEDSEGDELGVTFILTVDIDMLKAATREERSNRVPSHLRGTISMHRVATGRRLGEARIWSQGGGLDLHGNNSPDTLREFVSVIRLIIQ